MKHIKIYEKFSTETLPMEDTISDVHYESESSDITSSDESSEGVYFVLFKNSEGENTTIEISSALNPEFMGNSMVSNVEMIKDSSSDGRSYNVTGYYDKLPQTGGAYELKKVLIEEA